MRWEGLDLQAVVAFAAPRLVLLQPADVAEVYVDLREVGEGGGHVDVGFDDADRVLAELPVGRGGVEPESGVRVGTVGRE